VLLVDAQTLLRISLALGVAGGLAGANDDLYEDAVTAEDVLSDVCATDGGSDPICGEPP